jgi:hypothetical protein
MPTAVDRLRALCASLPEAVEEEAWVGTRWRVRGRTFAHVLLVDAGWPPAYARVIGTDGPCLVAAVRSSGAELDALRATGPPFFAPPWRSDEVLVAVDGIEPRELAELVTESYCAVAPARLAARVQRPEP